MGYNGMGMQRWISTMKPRKFLGKRSKPDGGGGAAMKGSDAGDYYHLQHRDLDHLKEKKYTRQYKNKLRRQLTHDKRVSLVFYALVVAASLVALIIFVAYINRKMHWF